MPKWLRRLCEKGQYMNIYLVNADRLHFSAKQLEAMTRLLGCGDLGGIIEGVTWVKDNDDDIIILASEWRADSHYMLRPRCHHLHHMIELFRAADRLEVIEWQEYTAPFRVRGNVIAERMGDSLILCYEGDVLNLKAINVNQGKLNISYKEDEQDDRT